MGKRGERMRDSLVVVVVVAALAACTPDTAHAPIFLAPPYDALPPARAGTRLSADAVEHLVGGWTTVGFTDHHLPA